VRVARSVRAGVRKPLQWKHFTRSSKQPNRNCENRMNQRVLHGGSRVSPPVTVRSRFDSGLLANCATGRFRTHAQQISTLFDDLVYPYQK
jgi:hypothetical protein